MAQAAQILTLPVQKLTFEADDFQGKKIVEQYDSNRDFVTICQAFLECSPEQMKKKIAKMESMDNIGEDAVQNLISDFEELTLDFVALSQMFNSAAARLTVVHRRLI